jgi:hypothetical protein
MRADVKKALEGIGFQVAEEDGEIVDENVMIKEDGGDDFILRINNLKPGLNGKDKYHRVSINGKQIKCHKLIMHTFVGTPTDWLSNRKPEGVSKKGWDRMTAEDKKAIRKLLGENAVQIDHIVPVSADKSTNAFRLDNLQFMLSSKNNKKGG